jgi:hypothetical protein
MFKRSAIFILLVLIIFTNQIVYPSDKPQEVYTVRKIVLGRFEVKNNKPLIPAGSINWPMMDRKTIAIDDNDNIYVLDTQNKCILLFNKSGKLEGKIGIPHTLKEPSYLEVSGDGNILYVYSYPNFFLISRKGLVIKSAAIGSSEVIRRCKDKFVDRYWRKLYDCQLNLIDTSKRRGIVFHPDDSKGNFYGGRGTPYLVKFSKKIKKVEKPKKISDILEQMWAKKIKGYEKITHILGIDGKDNVYLLAKPERRKHIDILKVDSNGELIASALLPKEAPFLTNEEEEEWLEGSSEEDFDFYKVTCKGNVFAIYSYQELPSKTYLRWLNKGEYYIVKFGKP